MKAVTTVIITILAIAGQSLAADLQSPQNSRDDEVLLAQYLERTQIELENEHVDAVNSRMHDNLNSLFNKIDSKLTLEAQQSLAKQSTENLPIPVEHQWNDAEAESAIIFG